jgi:hypothetical protein
MQDAQDTGSAEVWTAAPHRRTEDFSNWVRTFSKRSEKSAATRIGWRLPRLRLSFGRGLTVAIVALTALTSVSAVVHAKKQSHIVLRPTAALPAVNVP